MGEKNVLILPGRYENIRRICQFVTEGATRSGLDETAVFHIELACDEASANIIEHTYGAEDGGDIHISWHVAGNMFIVTILDNGPRFNPGTVPPPPSASHPPQPDDVDNIRVGGLGMHFMRQLMDEVTFDYTPDQGNTLVMKKKLPAKMDKQ